MSLVLLLTALPALAEEAPAAEGLYLRQMPQYAYQGDAVLTPESYPEVCIAPYAAQAFFLKTHAEPLFLCFQLQDP